MITNTNNLNKREEIYFSNIDISKDISDILKKVEIQEDPIDSLFMNNTKEESKIYFVLNATKDFVKKNMTEYNFINLLENKLVINNQKAKMMFDDLKKNLIPFAEIIKISDNTEDINTTKMPKLKQPIEIEKILPTQQYPDKVKKVDLDVKTYKDDDLKLKKNLQKIKKERLPKTEINNKSNKSDTYRESIE